MYVCACWSNRTDAGSLHTVDFLTFSKAAQSAAAGFQTAFRLSYCTFPAAADVNCCSTGLANVASIIVSVQHLAKGTLVLPESCLQMLLELSPDLDVLRQQLEPKDSPFKHMLTKQFCSNGKDGLYQVVCVVVWHRL